MGEGRKGAMDVLVEELGAVDRIGEHEQARMRVSSLAAPPRTLCQLRTRTAE